MFTPPLRRLTRTTSLGYDVIDFATHILGIDLFPWQRWLLIHALELLPDGGFRFRIVVVLVARQNGKSTVSQVLALFWMFVLAMPLVVGTAQDLDLAEDIWSEVVEMAEDNPELAPLIKRVVKVNGKKALHLVNRSIYKVKAINRRAGRGLTSDLVLLDELREHQNWDGWAAVTKTTQTRPDAQIWCMSNAGDMASVVLAHLRKIGHSMVGDPDGLNQIVEATGDLEPVTIVAGETEFTDGELVEVVPEAEPSTLGLFEWSAVPGCDIRDRDQWALANPSLGHLISPATLASDADTDPEWTFRTEVLCQWPDGALSGPFPPGAWETSTDAQSVVAEDSPVMYAVDTSWDRAWTYVGVVGWRPDGNLHGEIIARRAGQDWVPGWFAERADAGNVMNVMIQRKSPNVSGLAEDLDAVPYLIVNDLTGPDVGGACGDLFDRVWAATNSDVGGPVLYHRPQPVLDHPAATAVTKPLGNGWVWDERKSPVGAAPLMVISSALRGLLRTPPPARSAYEDADAMFV